MTAIARAKPQQDKIVAFAENKDDANKIMKDLAATIYWRGLADTWGVRVARHHRFKNVPGGPPIAIPDGWHVLVGLHDPSATSGDDGDGAA